MAAFLSGKKVYLTALAGAVYGVLIACKVTPNEFAVWSVIASGNVAAWRAAFEKAASKEGVSL
jgi:hypothetical protein